ncbi:MAG: metallophosphoesterase family protein [Desulfobacterales bacterium]
MKIGLISDTHIPEAGDCLPEKIKEVFRDTELILHAGDLHILDVLDWLEDIAPVKAARGNGDEGMGGRSIVPEDPRILPAHVLHIQGIRIGLTHSIPLPEEVSWIPLAKTMDRLFGGAVDVIVFGDSHVDYIKQHDGVLLVNPGSPTLPFNLVGYVGTVGILEIEQGKTTARIVPLGKWPIR